MFTSAETLKHRERLLFKTEAAALDRDWRAFLADRRGEYARAAGPLREEIAESVAGLCMDLGSYLMRWNPRPPEPDLLAELVAEGRALLEEWRRPEAAARVQDELASISASNFMKLSRLTDRGVLNTRWGNDSAVGLARAARRGAVLITTNPVMINNVRKLDPAFWEKEKAALQLKYRGFPAVKLASYITMEVVRRNCAELRPVYEASGGSYGYVCLQVNPRNSRDAESMAREALELYAEMSRGGPGRPNLAFKIPGTAAGLEAAAELAANGVAVTMTASASISQLLAMAPILERGSAAVSYLTVMNGRLDDPIGEELLAKGVSEGRQIARWASTCLIRKAYRLLYKEMGIRMPTILAASLRGPWNVEGSITDGAKETIVTAFPDKAVEYDQTEREIRSHMDEQPPKRILETLEKSGIFRQAYHPEELSVDGFDDFFPVKATLEQFARSYDEFLEYIAG